MSVSSSAFSFRSAHRLLIAASLAIGTVAVLPPAASADDAAAQQSDSSKYNFDGLVNSADTQVRSGPGDNYYPTAKLDKGMAVKVVGIRYDWLKVEPPAGSFSYVAKAFVTRFGDGSKGRVDKPDLRVRAGSVVNQMKTTVQTTLNVGDEVTILGEVDEYYKITPPPGVYLYVNKGFVDATKSAEPVAKVDAPVVAPIAKAEDANKPIAPSNTVTPDKVKTPETTVTPMVAVTPATQPAAVAEAVTPSTQPVAAAPSSESIFDKLESDFAEMSKLPLDQQNLDSSMAAYTSLQSSDLPESLKRVVDVRVATLKARGDAKTEFVALKKSQSEATQREVALKAEQQELQDRIKKAQVSMFTAVGTLRTSSLQSGQTTLYRLTDPANGRTLVYIKSNDQQYAALLNQFVGVHGPVTTDGAMAIRYITPTDASAVDQAKVNNGITAEMIPASLLPRVSSAQ